jgi:uncharacterized protein
MFDLKTIVGDRYGKKYVYFPKCNLTLPEELACSDHPYFEKVRKFMSKVEINKGAGISRARVLNELANVRKMLLEVSEDCNLRCRYCIYSGQYHDIRKHSKSLMDWKTARDSVDFFFNWILKNRNKKRQPYIFHIAFYGGEPLLNFNVIKKTVNYARGIIRKGKNSWLKRAELSFDMTTNGLLLGERELDFLFENRFRLLISLDGPLKIQEKNRGRGSFVKLLEKIQKVYKKYPEYYKTNVSYSVVYARDTDLKKVVDFFSQDIFERCFRVNYGQVSDRFTDLKFPKYGINEKSVIEEIKEKKICGTPINKIEQEILNSYYNFDLSCIKRNGNLSAHCILGTKMIYVRTRGCFSGCERAKDSFVIGNLNMGFDINKIIKIEREFLHKTSKCRYCVAQSFCGVCIATIGVNASIDMDTHCRKIIEQFNERMSECIDYCEMKQGVLPDAALSGFTEA